MANRPKPLPFEPTKNSRHTTVAQVQALRPELIRQARANTRAKMNEEHGIAESPHHNPNGTTSRYFEAGNKIISPVSSGSPRNEEAFPITDDPNDVHQGSSSDVNPAQEGSGLAVALHKYWDSIYVHLDRLFRPEIAPEQRRLEWRMVSTFLNLSKNPVSHANTLRNAVLGSTMTTITATQKSLRISTKN